MLHTVGSCRAYKEIKCNDKWLRIHPHQEWYEDYLHSSVDDLDRFFERFLKGKKNGWEATPKVRVSMYRFGETVRQPFSSSTARVCLFRDLADHDSFKSIPFTIKWKKTTQSLGLSTQSYT